MSFIYENYCNLIKRIQVACKDSKRDPSQVTLVCVTKNQKPSTIQELILSVNANSQKIILGENYLQEWQTKRAQITGDFQVHFIGSLQSNKLTPITLEFDAIETVDSLKKLTKIDKICKENYREIEVFLQVNISQDPNKSGFNPEELVNIFKEGSLPNLEKIKLSGLMCITALYSTPDLARPDFIKMRELREKISEFYAPAQAFKLSMGMSQDFDVAISEGADIVRVGSAIFTPQ